MTSNNATTTYLVDLEGGLSQVLSDGTNSYLYGLDRIAQMNGTDTQYFLGDALGSVRQLSDEGSAVSLAKGYDPFGNASWNVGAVQTPYGYTSEQTDANGLVYLRARYYASGVGRFLSKDTWVGDHNQPLSLNRWNYVEGNPINHKDPSGHIEEGKEATVADDIWQLLKNHGISIVKDWGDTQGYDLITNNIFKCGWNNGRWNINELEYILKASNNVQNELKGWNKLHSAVGNITVNKIDINSYSAVSPPFAQDVIGDIVFLDNYENDEITMKYYFAHEFAHVWDYRTGLKLSHNLIVKLGTWVCTSRDGIPEEDPYQCWKPYGSDEFNIDVDSLEQPPDTLIGWTSDKGKNKAYSLTYGGGMFGLETAGMEDWATAFGYKVYPAYASFKGTIGLGPIRMRYVEDQINNLH